MEIVAPGIYRIPPGEEPLSSDVFIVEGEKEYYVYDVGSNDEAFAALSALDKPVTVILSHFHQDHTGNMRRLSPARTLAGARTRKYIGCGTLVEGEVQFQDGVSIRVLPCVSPHAPGSLIMLVNDTYAFLGDLCYARPGTGQGEARGMLRVLQGLPVRCFIQSHRQDALMQEKADLIGEVKAYFGIGESLDKGGRD